MNIDNFIKHLDIKYNKYELRKEFRKLEFKSVFTSDNIKDSFLRAEPGENIDQYPIIKTLSDKLQCTNVFGFTLAPNAYIHMHTDPPGKPSCAVNIILSDNYGPVVFQDYGEIMYECALFNNSVMHSVPSYPEERLLLMFGYFNDTYDNVKEKLVKNIKNDFL
tara:strand:+ start:328 stop:816 length:489 start_codon:yes stop_codon:yes gene_type:complete